MTLMAAVRMSGVAVLATMFIGCGSSDSETGDNGSGGNGAQPVLTGAWTLNQGTVNNVTLSTAAYGVAELTLNADGTMQVVATPTGGDQRTYTGTYTTNGSTISFTVAGVPDSAGVTMPVTATYTFDADSLEIQLAAPITVSGFAVSAVFLVR